MKDDTPRGLGGGAKRPAAGPDTAQRGKLHSINLGIESGARAPLSKCWLWPALLALAILWVCGGTAALAEARFPPPEFETGHVLPLTATPSPRSLAMQYVDVAALLGALGLACYLVHRRRSRRGIITLSLFSLIYFGFYREGCICAIGAVQNVALALCDASYALPMTVLVFFFAPLVVALFAGRTFCAAVCPHGALQDLVLIRPVKVPAWLDHGLSVVPFLFLGAGLAFAATGSAFIICRYDPFVPLFRLTGSATLLALGGLFVLASLFIGRPYCRFLCPYGALLRLAALASKWRVRITPDFCTQCRLCEEACPYGAIREPALTPTTPQALVPARRRLGWLLLLLPVALVVGGWVGSKLSVPFSKVHPTVALAERYADPNKPTVMPIPATPDSLALGRAERDAPQLVAAAVDIRRRFVLSGWLFGGWTVLVVFAKLIGLSVRPDRTDFEPDRGACVACARCFMACPNERVRLGLLPASAIPNRPEPGLGTGPTAAGTKRD